MASQKALNRLREGYIKHKNENDNVEESLIEEYKNKFLFLHRVQEINIKRLTTFQRRVFKSYIIKPLKFKQND